MLYGAMNSPFQSVADEIPFIARQGFDYLELTMDAPYADHRNLETAFDEVQNLLASNSLGLICHLPTFVQLADLTPGLREASVRETVDSLQVAKELGCEKVVLHPWFLSGLGPMLPDIAQEYGRKSLETVLEEAGSIGLEVCLENLFPRAKSLVRPDDFTCWLDRYPQLQLTLDTGHANLAGGTKLILAFIERFGERLGHLHVSDNRGRSDDHLPIGAGNIDFGSVAKALQKVGYNKTVTFEVFTEDREYVRHCREKFRELMAVSGS